MSGSKKQEACMQCTEKCLKAHRKKPSSVRTPATSISFFKVMIGDFEEAMFIPPNFAQTFRDFVNKDTCLEDSNGRCWRVRVSVVDGSLAFHQGWRDFVLDHNIGLGELVTFKYISRSLLSTQIFGTSACERLHFREQSNINKCKRKRSKTKIPLDILRLEKNHKSSEDSKEKCFAVDEHLAKDDRVMKPEKSPHCDSSGRLETALRMKYYEAPSDTNNKDAMRVEEASKISFIDLCIDEDMNTQIVAKDYSFPSLSTVDRPEAIMVLPINSVVPETTEARCCFHDTEKLMVYDEILSCQHDRLIKYPLLSTFKQEMMIIPPVDLADPETIDTPRCSQDIDRLPYSIAISNCTEDVEGILIPSSELVNKDAQTEQQFASGYGMDDTSCIETIGSDPLSMTDISEFHKAPVVMEGDTRQADLPEDEGKKVILCSKGKAFGVVKTESKDSISLPSPNYANFSFSATVNAQSWLKLPECLPAFLGKKKLGRKVVTLRDPNMRSWPVLYHESIRFVGFTGGWEEFATANNLLNGDRCEFEFANEREPTLQARRSEASS